MRPALRFRLAIALLYTFTTLSRRPLWIFGDGFDGQTTGFWSTATP